ncbi:MAG: hypothetical protein ABJP48_11595 [Erythrobacter sp.]
MKTKARNLALAAIAFLAIGGLAVWLMSHRSNSDDQNYLGEVERTDLGLMTSLPLYWPLGADFAEFAQGTGEVPWQRAMLEQDFDLVLLDTLTPIPGLTADESEFDPLAQLDQLAVIQPRGLSPSDNAALDQWVRAGGRLLLVLDPALTGDYELALGDPRRPVDAALIPPLVAHWGLEVVFDELQAPQRQAKIGELSIEIALAGEIRQLDQAQTCDLSGNGTLAHCQIGAGAAIILADAKIFEDEGSAEQNGSPELATLLQFMRFAFP